MNESLTKGIVPDCYKHALIKPLLKKSSLNENDFNNFRPVSNLAFLSKLLEKLVLRQLSKHMKHNELEEIYQSAYKAFHSTETALLKVTSDVLEQLDNKKVCFLILLDLSAAFDTIDHGILLKRLRVTFGLSGTVLEWFQSYLSGRFQSVVVGGEKSTSSPLTLGVPQGSVLGPVLFTIYTQPLAEILTKHGMKYHLYADDTQIYVSGTRDEIPEMSYRISCCVTDVKAWMTCNKLKLNDDKTELLLIDKDGYASHDTAVDINGHFINCTNKVKNLGVILDREMSMIPAVSDVVKKLYVQVRKIGSIRCFLNEKIAKTLVTSLVLSRLDYCNSLLAGLPDRALNRLQIAQNNAARMVTRTKRLEHITPVLKELHWLPVKYRVMFKICMICFKCLNNIAPAYLTNDLNIYTPSRALRSSMDKTKLDQKRFHYKYFGERSFMFLGPKLWNQLPIDIREASTLISFKSKLKSHLFRQAFT